MPVLDPSEFSDSPSNILQGVCAIPYPYGRELSSDDVYRAVFAWYGFAGECRRRSAGIALGRIMIVYGGNGSPPRAETEEEQTARAIWYNTLAYEAIERMRCVRTFADRLAAIEVEEGMVGA